MGISRLSVLVIQTRGEDVRCEAGGPGKNGKYVAWVMLYDGEEFDHPIVSTQPIFDSKEEAVAHAEKLVVDIRAID